MGEQSTNEISVYNGVVVDVKTIATELRKLKAAFPKLENDYISVIAERIQENGFTEERLKDAVAHLIDTFRYPNPTIADVIGFDKRVRLYCQTEYENEIYARKAAGSDFIDHWIGKELYRVKKSDCVRYGFRPNQMNQNKKQQP